MLRTLRWVARISGLLVAGAFLLLVWGELLTPHAGGPATLQEWSGIVLLTVTCAAMLAAWRWELPGAAVSLAALIAYTLLIHFARYTVHVVLAIPGILYLADWFAHRPAARASGC